MHLGTRIKEHIPKFLRHRKKNQLKIITEATSNARNRSLISENLVKNQICG